VTTFAAPSTKSADPRSPLARGIALASVLICAVLSPLVLPAPASAVVTEVGTVKVGLTPRNVAAPVDGDGASVASFENAAGNPVLHGSKVYVLYWDPADIYHGDWQGHIDTFMQELGSESGSLSNVFAVATQYTDKSNVPATYGITFRGSYTDTSPYPISGCTDPSQPSALACVTDQQIQTQLQSFIASHGLPKGMGVVYYVLTPPHVSVCLDAEATHCSDYTRSAKEITEKKFTSASYLNSLCSYHSDINPGGLPTGDANTVLYATIPWSATTLGGVPAYECQDGGYNPDGKVAEESERPAERTKKQQEEFEEGNAKQKLAILEQEEREGPHAEEPNQSGLGPDGTYDTALSDLIVNQIALEQQDIVTNPLLNAWQDSAHNEDTDECRDWFATGGDAGSVTPDEHTLAGTLSNQTLGTTQYYLQTAFNLAALRLPYPGVPCVGGVNLIPSFTSPNPVNTGDVIGFDGMESDIDLNSGIAFSAAGAPKPDYATYAWSFGDGTPVVSGFAPGAPLCEAPWLSPCDASVFHTYATGGRYDVTLTVTDVGGNSKSVTREVLVAGPPPASAGAAGAGAGAGAAGAGSTTGAGTSAAGTVPAPVAVASVASRSLRTALKKGLVVRYSVNEQVAGHLEVLLARSLAKSLKVGGSPATRLPAGTPPQLVIAKAVLITTKAGHSTVAIKFSKTVAKRLSHAHKLSLLLRLVVRNAAKSPASTTVLSKVTLAG
jgi:hypothetical protein